VASAALPAVQSLSKAGGEAKDDGGGENLS